MIGYNGVVFDEARPEGPGSEIWLHAMLWMVSMRGYERMNMGNRLTLFAWREVGRGGVDREEGRRSCLGVEVVTQVIRVRDSLGCGVKVHGRGARVGGEGPDWSSSSQ